MKQPATPDGEAVDGLDEKRKTQHGRQHPQRARVGAQSRLLMLPVSRSTPNARSTKTTVPPWLRYRTESLAYEYAVSTATAPASAKAIGVAPRARSTAKPRTAKIPPPTIPPTPMATVDQYPSEDGIRILGASLLPVCRASTAVDGARTSATRSDTAIGPRYSSALMRAAIASAVGSTRLLSSICRKSSVTYTEPSSTSTTT